MNSNVEKLVRKDNEGQTRQVIAVPTQIIMNVDQTTQVIFQVGFDLDETDAVINGRIDRVLRIAERRKAMSELNGLYEERLKADANRELFLKAVPISEAKYKVEVASLNVQKEEIKKAKDDYYAAGYEDFRGRGRTGQYKPVGKVASQITGCDLELGKIEAQIERLKADRELAIENEKNSVARYEGAVREWDDKIAAKRRLINGEPADPEPDGA